MMLGGGGRSVCRDCYDVDNDGGWDDVQADGDHKINDNRGDIGAD